MTNATKKRNKENKLNVLITGASNGIGKEVADIFLANNHFVIGLDIVEGENKENLVSFKVDICDKNLLNNVRLSLPFSKDPDAVNFLINTVSSCIIDESNLLDTASAIIPAQALTYKLLSKAFLLTSIKHDLEISKYMFLLLSPISSTIWITLCTIRYSRAHCKPPGLAA